jgi:NAD(P)-dependent dehydrogenase (short-subunit alcohol dehydrogenase family)
MTEQQSNRIEGRTVVVTGAASGIGRAIAEGFLRDGALVVGGDVQADGLAAIAELGAVTRVTDVRSREDVEALIETAREAGGRIDALFNNAGIAGLRRVDEFEPGEFERVIEIHLFGTLYGMRAALPGMREQGHGRIINALSRAAEFSGPSQSAYSSAKAALWALTRSAAAENRDLDILINGLIPGPTNTAIWGRDMPQLQSPEVVYPTARMLATLPEGGPSGQVFWNEKVYPLMDPANRRTRGRR